jgi:hypothetical protein
VGSPRPDPPAIALFRRTGPHVGLSLGPQQVEQAFAIARGERIYINHTSYAVSHLVGDASCHHSTIGMAQQGDVLQVLEFEHRRHVMNMGGEVDFVMHQMGPLAQPGIGWREELVASGAEQWPHFFPCPGGRPSAMSQHDCCHISVPPCWQNAIVSATTNYSQ